MSAISISRSAFAFAQPKHARPDRRLDLFGRRNCLEDFRREVDKELTGREDETVRAIYFKV